MIPISPATRLQLIMEMLDPNEYDDEGNIIGQKEPLITIEAAKTLLEFKDEDS